ncbi:hypothetical protein G6F22_021542 [Rhizopus arrhizus]|nr:hypothetical protein G6F22_021542 [Rhizopus arrhizus]
MTSIRAWDPARSVLRAAGEAANVMLRRKVPATIRTGTVRAVAPPPTGRDDDAQGSAGAPQCALQASSSRSSSAPSPAPPRPRSSPSTRAASC